MIAYCREPFHGRRHMLTRNVLIVTFAVLSLTGLTVAVFAAGGSSKEISLSDLRDKIQGGWAGQMIGVSFGAPTEFRFRERTLSENDLPEWTPDKVSNALNQDDLYVDMTFAKVLDDKGVGATTEDF